MLMLFMLMLTLGTIEGKECSEVSQLLDCGTLICLPSKKCGPCNATAQCDSRALVCHEGHCVVDSLSASFSGWTVGAVLIAFAVGSFAVVSGIGGGGILVPLYVTFLVFPSRLAVALSQATILGQSSLNAAVVMRRRHPKETRPVINYDVLLLMLPMTLAGTTAGQLIGSVVADWLRLFLLLALLGYIEVRVVGKYKTQKAVDEAEAARSLDSLSESLIPAKEMSKVKEDDVEDVDKSEDQNLLNRDSFGQPPSDPGIKMQPSQYPLMKIGWCAVLWVALAVLTTLKSESPGPAPCGSGTQ